MARLAFKKQRNRCTKLLRQSKREYFEKVTQNGGKRFWEVLKPFVTDKGSHGNEEFILEENGELIKDPVQVSDWISPDLSELELGLSCWRQYPQTVS